MAAALTTAILVTLFTAAAEQLLPHNNAVSLYVANTDLSQWSTVEEAFRTELAERAETFCALSLEECNFASSSSVSLSKDDVVYFAGFPAEIDNHLRIVIGVGVPTEDSLSLPSFLPQSQLASIVLINQLSLQVAAGSIIGLFSLYTQEEPSPTPTAAPEPTPEAAVVNAILIILTQASLTDWEEGSLEGLFREAVTAVASDHCTTSPTSCNIDIIDNTNRRRRSDDVIFDGSSVYVIPEYPNALGDTQMEIAFAVTLPFSLTLVSGATDYFIPQSTLLSLGLDLSPVLAETTGAYIIGISAYQPRAESSPASLWSQIGVAVTVPSVILTLLLLGIPTGVLVYWLRRKRHKEVYNVDNYVRGVEKEVETVRLRQLRGVYSPVQSEDGDEGAALRLCEFGEDGEDVTSESGEEDGVSGGGSEPQYYSAHNMFDVPRDTESETAFSINRNLS